MPFCSGRTKWCSAKNSTASPTKRRPKPSNGATSKPSQRAEDPKYRGIRPSNTAVSSTKHTAPLHRTYMAPKATVYRVPGTVYCAAACRSGRAVQTCTPRCTAAPRYRGRSRHETGRCRIASRLVCPVKSLPRTGARPLCSQYPACHSNAVTSCHIVQFGIEHPHRSPFAV